MKKIGLDKIFFNSVAIYSLSDFITKLISLIVIPLYAIYLSAKLFGVLELISVSISLISVAFGIGLANSLNRYFYEKNADTKYQIDLFSTGFNFLLLLNVSVYFIFSIALYSLDGFMNINFYDQSPILFYVALTLLPLSNLLNYSQTMLRMRFKPKHFMVTGIISYSLPPIISIYLMKYLNLKLEAIFYSSAICLLIGNIYAFIVNKDYFNFSISKKILVKILKFGAPFIFTSLAYWAYSSLDRIFISAMLTIEDVGSYAIASKVALVPLLVFTAIGTAWNPLVMKLRKDLDNDAFKYFLRSSLALSLLVGLLLSGFIALFCGEIISLLFPKEYSTASYAAIFLTIGASLNFSTQVTGLGISLAEKTILFTYLSFFGLLINGIGNYILVPALGVNGAGLSTLVSYLFLTTSYSYFSFKLYPINPKYIKIIFLLLIYIFVLGCSLYFLSYILTLISLSKAFIMCPILILIFYEFRKIKEILQ